MNRILNNLQQATMMTIVAARAAAKSDFELAEHYLGHAVAHAQIAADLIKKHEEK